MDMTRYLMVAATAIAVFLIFQIPRDFMLGWSDWIKAKVGDGIFAGVTVALMAGAFLVMQQLLNPEASSLWTDIGVGAVMILLGLGVASILWFWLQIYRDNR